MFKPAKMDRVRLIIHKRYFGDTMSALQDLGVLQIESIPEKAAALLKPQEGEGYREASDYTQRFRGLEGLLYPVEIDKKFTFMSIKELMDRADSIRIDERVTAIRKEMDALDANEKDITSRLSLLIKLANFNHDLSILNNRSVVSFVVTAKQPKLMQGLVEEMGKKVPTLIKIDLLSAMVFSMKKSDEKEFSAVAEKHKVSIEFIPEMHGKVEEESKVLQAEFGTAGSRKASLNSELRHISEKYYPLVVAIREQLDIEMERFELTNKLVGTDSVVALEGWIPSPDIPKMERVIKNITGNRFILEHVGTKEHPPTKMVNPAWSKLYEFFVRFYSLPQSDEIDPTIMFAMAFPIFFGFMVGDVGYGAVILCLALWILHRLDHPPKKSMIPRAVTSFVSTIVSPNGLRILARSIIPGAIIAMIFGAILGEYFGFQPYVPIFDATKNLSTLLVLSGWIGVFMVEFGFFLGFLNKLHAGENRHAIAKVGWMVAGIGMVIFGLNVLHRADLGTGNWVAVASYLMLIGGVVCIAIFEGVQSLMELPSLISHMLSYTRLVGILLASVILAEVVDLIFIGGWHHGIILGLVGTVILVVGQMFNIGIAMFEPGIQGARLIYVEFFSKFYSGNGKQYKPFSAQRRHTLTRFRLE